MNEKEITIDNTENGVSILLEFSKVKPVPSSINNSQEGAIWLLETYPGIESLVKDREAGEGQSYIMKRFALLMALQVSIEVLTEQAGGSIHAALSDMVVTWCSKEQEELFVKATELVSVSTGLISQGEMEEIIEEIEEEKEKETTMVPSKFADLLSIVRFGGIDANLGDLDELVKYKEPEAEELETFFKRALKDATLTIGDQITIEYLYYRNVVWPSFEK